jgi:hypothetical protein
MSCAGKINVYVCPQGHRTVTIDAVEGVTPFMIRCRNWPAGGCDDMAQSSFYRVDQNAERPDWEWHKPNEAELNKLDEATAEHVRRGGLLLRKLDPIRRDSLAQQFGLVHLRVRA